MHAVWIVIIGTLLASAASAQIRERITVPSDPRATYFALRITPVSNGRVEILTRRTGPSGFSFALRLVDCRSMRFTYLGEGDTEAQAEARSSRQAPMGPLISGSISDVVSRFACDYVRRR